MSEAVEYRIKRNRQSMAANTGAVIWFVGVAVLALSQANDGTNGVGVFGALALFGVAAYIWTFPAAMKQDGYCRRFHEWRGEEYSDPPLDEWCDDLEDRDAFHGERE